MQTGGYRGRLAPSPTGRLHAGHARTFLKAQERARAAGGTLVLRMEDIDRARCRPEFCAAIYEDLRTFGLVWDEGPDIGGPFGPYMQSERREWHVEVWRRLLRAGVLYPCRRSRKDVAAAAGAPHIEGEEPIYPIHFRPAPGAGLDAATPDGVNWRFRVPYGRTIAFLDGRLGPCSFTGGLDFGDFIIWRHDGVPSYQLAVVADDHAMGITEVVRGEDLVVSTARQLLIYEALGWHPPAWWHCELVRDSEGRRLAKRNVGGTSSPT